jgi:hypothetical protein
MHEDIDHYEPDMEQYYNMDDDERSLRNEKYRTYIKYADGKISYDQYINELESYFYEILEANEWDEIKKYRGEQLKKNALAAPAERALAAKKKDQQGLRNAVYYVLLILILFLLIAAIFD